MELLDRLKLQAENYSDGFGPLCKEAANEIERLNRVIGNLRAGFRVNLLRLLPETTHDEISEAISKIEAT